ncbi:dienelactone hydrolase family protein [Azohydromonas caseinilytica]|uniref:Dienelactone hydrolase family protein n=1 Tax=Azohydromonas caseinilytica TaxID=2728836 RepID=A0A848FIS0_9BURK|nr:dienelactone hydrolase family protein [Azohydromonas caseinilytica]NML18795.1 dienelactone hydrolase family protein [Azohydromonas caseinilytica]
MTDPKAPRQTAADFHPEVLRLFDQYVHGGIDRRMFLDRATRYAVAGGTTAAGLLAALSPDFARAQKVVPTDPRLKADFVEIDSPAGYGKARAYVVRPARARGPLPVVLVAHENRGLNPHIEDIARRLALEGFMAVAPDALFPLGGYPGDEDKARERFAQLDAAKTREDFVAAAGWARNAAGGNGRLGAVGFCWGGGTVNMLATRMPDLAAAVPFYGPAPALDQAARIKAQMLLVFADNDERVNATWPPYEEALKQAGVRYEAFKYAGTQHGFHNDTTPRYDEAAARRAWSRTLALFNRTLRT